MSRSQPGAGVGNDNVAQALGHSSVHSNDDFAGQGSAQERENRYDRLLSQRSEPSPSSRSLSSSFNQKTPARSYFQHSLYDTHNALIDNTRQTDKEIREETAELASWALSDAASIRHELSPTRHSISIKDKKSGESISNLSVSEGTFLKFSNSSTRSDAIEEVSEPSSPESSSRKSAEQSALTQMLKCSSLTETEEDSDERDSLAQSFERSGVQPVDVHTGIISQPHERTPLLERMTAYGSIKDLENNRPSLRPPQSKLSLALRQCRQRSAYVARIATHPKSWDKRTVLELGLLQPLSYIPPVILGLLLNILDALSYGMILFPLGNSTFEDLAPDGISMFYVSCIVSQLTYSLNGSVFKGAIGSEMIEVVPFFHKMAFTIRSRVGEENRSAIIATTITAYALSSILTGLVFFLMGSFRLGTLIGFFPRHILLGCIGGVGWFLVATGVEVSARLEGSLHYNKDTLEKLFERNTLALWTVPLALALCLFTIKRRVKHPLTDATFFISIIAIFYFFFGAIPEVKMPALRKKGWVFEAPEAGVPWYHFYTLYDFQLVDWSALGSTFPAMLALTFFGVLHVPINIPALGVSTGEDNLDVDRELRAHGISNALSGLCGSIQNYLVYTNTLLFIRSGGNSRIAGTLLAFATFAVMLVGPIIIGFVPVTVVGALIFFLGIDLVMEALVQTYGVVHRLEYFTIIVIVLTMGLYDFVVGILVGIVLACVSFVVQTSRISAIRGKLYGGDANSTVRRHPLQNRFLEDAGKQIQVMKLAGYLFFGTIVGVEKQIRVLLDEETFRRHPIRFLVLDLWNVDGIDYSAAETFLRINRILNVQGVELIICGMELQSEAGRGLQNVGMFREENGVTYFHSLNSALEFCENELLKAFYYQRDAQVEPESIPPFLEVPKPEQNLKVLAVDSLSISPRKHQLHQVATETLSEQNPAPPFKWQDYPQPKRLILQTFCPISDKAEEFWYRAVPCFKRRAFAKDAVLYSPGDRPDGFYVLERGILKARYELPQGKYSELIVAGTTCGELPFFSGTVRTSTTIAQTDCVTWVLDEENWRELQKKEPDVAQELLKLSLRLTSERMDSITKYMLLTSG